MILVTFFLFAKANLKAEEQESNTLAHVAIFLLIENQ